MTEKDTSPPQERQKSSIWGGRFSSGPSQLMQDINASIDYDRRLFRQDIAGSKAHASMLAQCGIISPEDRDAIHAGLETILGEIAGGGQFSEKLGGQSADELAIAIEEFLTSGGVSRRFVPTSNNKGHEPLPFPDPIHEFDGDAGSGGNIG